MITNRLTLRLGLLAIIIAAIAWVALNRDKFDPSSIDKWLSGFGIWAAAAYVAFYALGTIIFVPGLLFALAGGALFGPFWGSILNLLGATAGASLAFLTARYIAGDWVSRKAGGRLKQLIDGVTAEGWRFIAFVRLVPLFPFNLTNYALGLTPIGFWTYAATSFVAMAPGAVAYTWLGYASREAIDGNSSAIRYGLLALSLLVAIAFLPRFVKRVRSHSPVWIDPQDLRNLFTGNNPVKIVDVRGQSEFAGVLGHIPGAINIPLNELNERRQELQDAAGATIVLVCHTDKRSAVAAQQLKGDNFADIRVLRGGMTNWSALNFEVSREGTS